MKNNESLKYEFRRVGPPPGLVREPWPIGIALPIVLVLYGVPAFNIISYLAGARSGHDSLDKIMLGCSVLIFVPLALGLIGYFRELKKDRIYRAEYEAFLKTLKEGER